MKTYKDVFSNLKRAALMPFFVIGDPDFDTSLELVKTAVDAGVDMLELGIAFSDPIADGPTIQKADIRALNTGMTVETALDFIKQVKRHKDIPIGLLMYYNLVCKYGIEKFFADAHAAGVNSVLVADLSIDDADEILRPAKNSGMDTVFMATAVTEQDRLKTIADKTTGFIYAVSLLGVTGSRESLSGMVKLLVGRLKKLTDVPVCVGFGISNAAQAVEIADNGADGVIIGSRIVKIIEENLNDKAKMLADTKKFLGDVTSSLEKAAG